MLGTAAADALSLPQSYPAQAASIEASNGAQADRVGVACSTAPVSNAENIRRTRSGAPDKQLMHERIMRHWLHSS
jgi:hypothetical protein